MTIILSFFLLLSTLSDQVSFIINKPVVQDERVYNLEHKMADAYKQCGDYCVDNILDNYPSDWYKGIDLYIDRNDYTALQMMKNDTEASWRDARVVAISAESMQNYSIIVVVSY